MSDADRIRELRDHWLEAADGDLRTAVQLLSTPGYEVYRIPSFLAQQAAEKALKAVLTHLQIDFPRTHDLERLQGIIPRDWKEIRRCTGLDGLTRHAVDTRYPDDLAERISLDEARAAVERAQALRAAIADDFLSHRVTIRH